MTLSSVAIASKWDETEKIKVFIVSTVGRKMLQSWKGERHNCTKSKKCGAIQCNLRKEKRIMCNLGYLKLWLFEYSFHNIRSPKLGLYNFVSIIDTVLGLHNMVSII